MSVMACVIVAAGAGSAIAAHRYNAPPVAADFAIGATTVPLAGRCAPNRVARHLIYRLDALDSGWARAFSRGFPPRTSPARLVFSPYNEEALPGYRPTLNTQPGIERVARALYRRGDGWTATRLQPPTGTASPSGRATYGLSLRVTRRGFPQYDAGAKIIIDCTSGRITRWNGPIGPG
jgi:hypothetical protein